MPVPDGSTSGVSLEVELVSLIATGRAGMSTARSVATLGDDCFGSFRCALAGGSDAEETSAVLSPLVTCSTAGAFELVTAGTSGGG
ncbi:hypothetical protein CKO25_11660 [Thiocapsa imhoffii]|uniref:Uncharacterized protein n=1 Tax=Thiocapsa imhoffii TaxID=382777 RepID=A0A9X0WIP8_9GAMM|nr:hypothetical protein [Thiocapsa imhoffii]MBK1645283.1 hypothetical protein [Thiocapsa imhoffii]